MARMGFRDPTGKQTPSQVIHDAIPEFARAAEIAQHFSGTGYEETVTALTQQAHMFGAFSGAALAQNVALATGAGLSSHMTAAQQANVLRFLTPAVKSMGVSPTDALALAATANQTGLTQNRGGSNLGALLRGLQPTGAPKHDRALADLESLAGGQFYKNGQFVQFPQMMRLLTHFYDTAKGPHARIAPEELGLIAKNALLVQGSQAAAVLGSDTSLSQFMANRRDIASYTPQKVEGIQQQLNMTLPGQLATLQGNLGSIQALLGAQLLPVLVPVVHGFVELTGAIVDMLRLHPGIAQFVATFAAVSTGAALIAGPVLIAAGAFGILSAAGIVASGAFLPFTLTILGTITAVTLVTLALTHWSTITGALTGRLGPLWQVVSIGAATLLGLAAAFGVVVAVNGVYATAMAAGIAVTTAFSAVSGIASVAAGVLSVAFGILDVVLSPVTLVVVGIGAAVAGVIYVFTHWGQVTGFVADQLRGLKAIADALLHGNYDAGFGAISHSIGGKSPVNPVNAGQDLGAWTRHTLHLDDLGRFLFSHDGGGASPEHWIPGQAGATQGLVGVVPAHLLTTPAGAPRLPAAFALPPLLAVPPLPARAPAHLVASLPASSASAAHVRRGPTPVSHMHGDTHLHFGPSSIVVHGAQGQDVAALAKLVAVEVEETIGRRTTMGQHYQASQFTGLEMPVVPFG